MTALHIRDVPEETVDALRRRAARRGHSMQAELREALAKAAAEPLSSRRSVELTLVTVDTGVAEPFTRDDYYDDAR